jgi:hypothetical protein
MDLDTFVDKHTSSFRTLVVASLSLFLGSYLHQPFPGEYIVLYSKRGAHKKKHAKKMPNRPLSQGFTRPIL